MQQRLATVVFGVLLGMPHVAQAQDSNSLESVGKRVKAGERVSVITTKGERLRARFDGTTASELMVRVDDKTVVVPGGKIAQVIHHDSNWNGAVIGASVVALSVLVGSLFTEEDAPKDAPTAAAFLAPYGFGIGYLIDRLHPRVVYKGGPQLTVRSHVSSFTPPGATKAGTRAGVRATIAW